MSIILGLETSGPKCSVSISNSGKTLAYKEIPDGYAHVSQITLLIQECLKQADLSVKEVNAIAISDGPGSYTGLRVGASTAKGFCYAQDIPLIAINTLELIAHEYLSTSEHEGQNPAVIAILDARRDEVYAEAFDGDTNKIFDSTSIVISNGVFDHLLEKYDTVELVGGCVTKCERILQNPAYIYVEKNINAQFLNIPAYKRFNNSQFENISSYTPFYLKPPNITISKK